MYSEYQEIQRDTMNFVLVEKKKHEEMQEELVFWKDRVQSSAAIINSCSDLLRQVATTMIIHVRACMYDVYTVYIIVRLRNTGVYGIYNPKALGCGARAKRGRY